MPVNYSQELLDRATAYVEQPLAARRYAEGLTEISQLYSQITGEVSGTCKQCQYSDYLAVVTNYVQAARRFLHPETMAETSYTFAPGYEHEHIAHERYNKKVTVDNLTDEDAEALLDLGYKHVIVKKTAEVAEKAADTTPKLTEKQTAQARYKELFGTDADEKLTIAKLTEYSDAKQADAAYQLPAA
jgi:uncharacterized protein (DUF1810 family)